MIEMTIYIPGKINETNVPPSPLLEASQGATTAAQFIQKCLMSARALTSGNNQIYDRWVLACQQVQCW
jgi:hypothetical protein